MDLSNTLKIARTSTEVLSKRLNDSSLDLKPTLIYSNEISTNIDIFRLKFDIEALAKITVFNEKIDIDDLGNYPNPLNASGYGKTMLRYDLSSSLNESFKGAFKAISLDFDSNQDIIISSYRIHPNTNILEDTILNDLSQFKTIYSSDDIVSLPINEGLAVTFNGNLHTNISLSYSDIFTETIFQLTNFLPKDTDIEGIFYASASLNCSIKVEDNFNIFIKKSENDKYYLDINRSKSNTTNANASFGISAKINNNDDSFSKFMENIFSALLGQPVDKVNGWINTGLSNLNEKEKLSLKKVINRIKVFENIDLFDDIIKTKYEHYKSSIIEKTKEIIAKKIEIGITYEYEKACESKTIFNATLSKKAIKENLKEILLLKIDKLENNDDINIEKYIFSKTESITHKIGFQLSIGKPKAYWFLEKKFICDIENDRLNKTKQITFSGQRTISKGFLNNKKWYFNFSGQTRGAINTPVAMNDFEYKTTIHWEDQQKTTTKHELADFLEIGFIWGCIETDYDSIYNNIKTKINNINDVKFRCEINIPSPEMNKLISIITNSNEGKYITSLCNSMPRYSNTYRKNITDLNIYNPLWKIYLNNGDDINIENYASLCEKQLKNLYPNIAKWEYRFKNGFTTIDEGDESFVGLIESNNLITGIKNLQKGFKTLNNMIRNKTQFNEDKTRENIITKIDDLVTSNGSNKTFNIIFLGRFLLDIAKEHNISKKINTKMTIEYKNNKNEIVELVFMKTS